MTMSGVSRANCWSTMDTIPAPGLTACEHKESAVRTPGSNGAKSAASWALVVLLTLGLAGCASGGGSPSAGPSPSASAAPTGSGVVANPCTLVTAEELAAVLGTVKKRPVRVLLPESGEEPPGLR